MKHYTAGHMSQVSRLITHEYSFPTVAFVVHTPTLCSWSRKAGTRPHEAYRNTIRIAPFSSHDNHLNHQVSSLPLPCIVSLRTDPSLQQEGYWRHLHDGPQYLEGWKAPITVARDSDQSDHWLTVAFATSDLTARGVDTDAYEACSALSVAARAPVRWLFAGQQPFIAFGDIVTFIFVVHCLTAIIFASTSSLLCH